MSWLFPGFLAGALLIGLPILLHLLRRKPKVVVHFPSLRFLGASAMRDARRNNIMRWLTLLLRCLIILGLAAAFARPFRKDSRAEQRHAMVIALDNSMSMQASGRWEALRAKALEEFSKLGSGDQAALLVMFPKAHWMVPLTDNLESVRAALLSAKPGYEKTRYGPALSMATETLAATPAAQRTLVWMADEQRIGWIGVDLSQPLPAGIELRLGEPAPEPVRQAAILHLQCPAAGDRLTAIVRLYQPQKDQRELVVSASGHELARQSVTLRAGENAVEIALPKNDATVLRVSLEPSDDLSADDTAWLVRSVESGGKVLLDGSEGTDFLGQALRSTKKLGVGGLEVEKIPAGVWPLGLPAMLRDEATFRAPVVTELDRFLEAGGTAWIFVNGSPEQSAWLAKQGIQVSERAASETPWHLRDWDVEHPILAESTGQSLLPLLAIEFTHGFNLVGEALTPFASWPDGSIALAEWNSHGKRLFLAGFPPTREATSWPSQPSFVPFVHQTARWLGAVTDTRKEWHVGDTIPLPAGEGHWRSLEGPASGQERTLSGSVQPEAPGVYEFVTQQTRQLFAVNTPPEESELTPCQNPERYFTQDVAKDAEHSQMIQANESTSAPSDTASEDQQRLWWWLLGACVLLLLAELVFANRTAL